MAERVTRQARGVERRAQVVEAAADLILDRGPAAVTHRAVAQRAAASLSATTYYFTDLDELLAAAGAVLMQRWVEHGEAVLASLAPAAQPDMLPEPSPHEPPEASPVLPEPSPDQPPDEDAAAVIVRATLPPTDDAGVRGHYEHLLAASRAPALAAAYADGRHHLDRMIGELLDRLGIDLPPALVLAVVDGGVISALSEGRPVRVTCERLVRAVLR